MLAHTALRFANHLLTGEAWARTRLQPFAGQITHLEFGESLVPLTITAAGLLASAEHERPAAVTISLPRDAPLRALTDRPALLASIRIAGAADLAETLSFVFRNLRWDAADDLSLLVGDIAANRLLQSGKKLAQWHLQRAKNLAINLAEYLTEETPALARRNDVAYFCTAVDAIQDDCNRFEKRLQRHENL